MGKVLSLEGRIALALTFHNPEFEQGIGEFCTDCSTEPHRFVFWPCPTVRALTGMEI